jgi:hypothetical protein
MDHCQENTLFFPSAIRGNCGACGKGIYTIPIADLVRRACLLLYKPTRTQFLAIWFGLSLNTNHEEKSYQVSGLFLSHLNTHQYTSPFFFDRFNAIRSPSILT